MLVHESGLVVVDVRAPGEFAKGHIQGARSVPAQAIERAGLPRDGHIVVYCSEPVCPLSTRAAKALIADGYPKVQLLEGGFAEWTKRGYPVQNEANTPKAPVRRARIGMRRARTALKDGTALALDVRPALEFSAGHLPHARNAPLEELDKELVRLPKGRKIVVYDRTAERSRRAADMLKAAGFDVTELAGGLAGWTRRGQKLVTKD